MDFDQELDILLFQVRRISNVQAKRFLVLLEALQIEHDIAFEKLKVILPAEYLNVLQASEFLSPQKLALLRKQVLDLVGDSCREISNSVERYIK